MPSSPISAVPMSSRPLARLLIHAQSSEVERIASTCGRLPYDAIYSAPSNAGRLRLEKLAEVVARHSELSGGGLPLLDANRYSGKNRVNGLHPLSAEWIKTQEALGLPYALTDSGFIEAGAVDQVESVLQRAKEIQGQVGVPVVAVLALAHSWLTEDSELLRGLIERFGVRVAIAVEHRSDPFGSAKAVRGLLRIVHANVPVWVLRTDLSSIGALASGAEHASLGTTTSLRHVYPSGKPGGKFIKSDWPSVLIRRAFVWKTLDRVIGLAATFPDDTVWIDNECAHCEGRRIDRSVRSEADAIDHNNEVVLTILGLVLSSPDPLATWRSMCGSAQFTVSDIESETGVALGMPAFLGAWWSATAPVQV